MQLRTVREAAALLDVSPRAVYRLVGAGEIGVERVGRRIRISDESLWRYRLRSGDNAQVRSQLWAWLQANAERSNPNGSSDDVLEELERLDDKLRRRDPRRAVA